MRTVVQNVKDRLGHNETVPEVSMNCEKMHISIWTLFKASSMQAALHMDQNYAKNLEIFKNSEFENVESLFQRYEHDDCRKFGNEEYISQRFWEPVMKDIYIAY